MPKQKTVNPAEITEVENKEESFPVAPKTSRMNVGRKLAESINGNNLSFSEIAKKIATNAPLEGCIIDSVLEITPIATFKGKDGLGERYDRQMFKIVFVALETKNRHLIMLKPTAYTEFVQVGLEAEKLNKRVKLLPKSVSDKFAPRVFVVE
ncbi:MAG TPA: hypothetical protein VGB37_09485 [Candidatus Lokiarchaeia archaeon]